MKTLTNDKYLSEKIDDVIENAEVIGQKVGWKIRLFTKGTINVFKIITIGVALLIASFIGGVFHGKRNVK